MNTLVEDELQELLNDLEVKRKQLAEKVLQAQGDLGGVDAELETIRNALKIYREAHGLPMKPAAPDDVLRQAFEGKTYKDILVDIALANAGYLVGKEATRIFVTAGLFPDKDKAAARIYSTLGRFPKLFEKIGRGEYRLATVRTLPNGTVTVTEPLAPLPARTGAG